MVNTEISVIVPVYNVEKYLPYCLQSIERQTYQHFELVLVDDGSSDRCGVLCDEYAQKHSNTVVIHQSNQGLSAARNNGMKKAQGKYVAFVDSDDIISEDYLNSLHTLITQYNADVSVGNMNVFWGEGKAGRKKDNVSHIFRYDTEEALEQMLYAKQYGVAACGKLFTREVLKGIEFPVGKLHEDQGTMYKILGQCRSLVYTDKPLYFYRQRSNSIVHTRVTPAHLYGLEAVKEQLDYIKRCYPNIIPAAEFRFAIVIFKWIPGITSRQVHDKEMFAYLRGELMPYYHSIMHNPSVSRAMKVRTLAVKCGYYPTRIVFHALDILKRRKSRQHVLAQ